MLTHGWPSTFAELLPLVDRLDGFDLVVPSLPGYGFSARPPRVGVDRAYVARLWHRLMRGLGYPRYGAHGGDFGAGVATHMALLDPAAMTGIHLSTPELSPYAGPGAAPLTARERAYLDRTRRLGPPANAATARSSPPSRRPSGTASTTPPPASPRGSWRSGARGATPAATSTAGSGATSC